MKKRYKEPQQYVNRSEKEIIDMIDAFCKPKPFSRSLLTHVLYKQFLDLPLEEDEQILKK